MKFKYYLRGCGLGIILTVIVMAVSINIRGGIMTDEKALSRAAELGMVMPEETETGTEIETETETGTESENETEVSDADDEDSDDEEASDSVDLTSEEGVTSEVDKVAASSDSDSDAHVDSVVKKATEAKAKTVTVKVEKGDVCRKVADKLYKNGLIEDSEEFRVYMQNKGYDDQICIGSFDFTQGMTYEEIAEILTSKS